MKKNTDRVAVDSDKLIPSLRLSLQELESALSYAPIVSVVGPRGSGRTSLVRALGSKFRTEVFDMERYASLDRYYSNKGHDGGYHRVEEYLRNLFESCDVLVLEDYDQIMGHAGSQMFRHTTHDQFFRDAEKAGKRIVIVRNAPTQAAWESVEEQWKSKRREIRYSGKGKGVILKQMTAQDYKVAMASALRDQQMYNADERIIHKFAPNLNLHQLILAINLLHDRKTIETSDVIRCLEDYILTTNVQVEQVEHLELTTLPGAEEIVEALETNIIAPFENRELALELGMRPKRGVLLYGPPGTGKTSIGRALAHRIRGKFFMIDGSVCTEPPGEFFMKFQRIVDLAKQASPSILFIDDADVLFGIHHVSGLVRYLLSLLDGVESIGAGSVCVMMTAMDPAKVPEALLRSGRVELWLETRLPNAETRERILERWVGGDVQDQDGADLSELGAMTEGFTPADLRRIAGDARLLHASDIAKGSAALSANDYLSAAANEIIDVRKRLAESKTKLQKSA